MDLPRRLWGCEFVTEGPTFSVVNRQSLHLGLAGYALLAVVSFPHLSGNEVLSRFVTLPLMLAIGSAALTYYWNVRDHTTVTLYQVKLGRYLNTIWLFLPVALGIGASLLVWLTANTDEFAWVSIAMAAMLGQRIADEFYHSRLRED